MVFHPGVATKAQDTTEETFKAVDSVGVTVEDSEDFAAFMEDGFRNNVVHSRQSEAC